MKLFFSTKRGAAFVMTMIMAVVALATVIGLYTVLDTKNKDIASIIATEGQAKNIAEAAHLDVLNWFRVIARDRQSRFFPTRNFSDPENVLDETDDPVIGLVREHKLSETPLLIARYEVRRQYYNPNFPGDPSKEDGHPNNDYIEIDVEEGVKGIKSQRNSSKEVFEIVSYGFIFKPLNQATYSPKDFYKVDTSVSFVDTNGESRNKPLVNEINHEKVRILASAKMRSEILELQVALPFPAAVCYRGRLQVQGRGLVQTLEENDSATTARRPGSSSPTISNGGTLDPAGSLENIIVQGAHGIYNDSVDGVFGLPDEDTLLANPDTIVFDSVEEMQLRTNRINFLGDSTTSDLPTFVIPNGSRINATNAILYVKGNLQIEANSNFFFTGILYVVGTLEMRDTGVVTGGVILQNRRTNNPNTFDQQSTITGSFDASTIIYQSVVIENLQKTLGQYTFFVPPRFIENDSEVAKFTD